MVAFYAADAHDWLCLSIMKRMAIAYVVDHGFIAPAGIAAPPCSTLSGALGAYTNCKCHISCAYTIALGPRLAGLPLCYAYFARLAALGAYTDCKCHTSCACTNALGPRVAVLPLCYAYFDRLAVHGAYTDCNAIPPVRLNMNRIIFGWLRRGALADRSSVPHARCRSCLTPPQSLCAT